MEGIKCRLNLKNKDGIFSRKNQNLPSDGQRNMVIRSKKPKRTWVKAKAQSIRIVGNCRYCKKEMTNDESFVAFLSTDKNGEREKAHYICMKKDDEQQQVEKKLWANLQTKMVEKKPSVFSW